MSLNNAQRDRISASIARIVKQLVDIQREVGSMVNLSTPIDELSTLEADVDAIECSDD